jgi:hypothetical protein
MGIAGAFMGDGMMQEIEKRMKLITNELCPRLDALIKEQQRTNELLDDLKTSLANTQGVVREINGKIK